MSAEPGTLGFVREVAGWATGLAVAIAVVGTVLTRDFRFALAFAIGAAVDIGTIRLVLRDAGSQPTLAEAGRVASLLIAARLALKAVLLGAAAALPRFLDLWGMAAGVLVFDGTLMTVGSFSAVMDVRRRRT